MAKSCLPWFHAVFTPMALGKQIYISSGCSVNSAGNIPCAPEAMRASAETKLAQAGSPMSLSLDTYTLARYMQGEVGSGSIEERVAVGETAVNRAKRQGMTITDLLLNNPATKAANRGWYGPIHGVGTGVSTAPYGRWATTAADPTLLTILLANLVMSGESDNFSDGADDQDGPEAWVGQGQEALYAYVRRLATNGKYWVGPLPGVDHWRTFLQFTPNAATKLLMGPTWLQRGLDALTLANGRAVRPTWDAMPVCDKPGNGLVFLGIAGTFLGAWAFHRGLIRRLGQ